MRSGMRRMKKLLAIVMVMAMMCTLCNVSGVKADETSTYSVTYSLTGVTVSPGDTSVTQGSSMTVTLTAQSGYTLPDSVEVSMGGNTLTDGYSYSDGVLEIDEVYGDTVITATGRAEASSYSISYDLYEVTASKPAGNVEAGTSYSVKLKAKSGYTLKASNVGVEVDGKTTSSGYSYSDGVLEIDAVSGDTVIVAVGVKKSSSSKSSSDKKTTTKKSSKKSTKKSSSSTSTSSSGTNSKSAQALKSSGGTPTDYTSGEYTAPKTGQDFDIRYVGAMAMVLMGAGVLMMGRRVRR